MKMAQVENRKKMTQIKNKEKMKCTRYLFIKF